MATHTLGRTMRPAQHPRRTGTIFYWTAGILVSIIFLVPLLWAVIRSLQPAASITAAPSWNNFTDFTGSNYSDLFSGQIHLWRYIGNSLIVSIGTGVLVAVLSALAGYGFAKFRFAGSGLVFGLIILTLMVPFQAVLTPLFLELNALHLTDSRIGLILFYTTFNLPFGVFVMRNSFASLPPELEESAFIDGCGPIKTLLLVLRPLILPGVATTILFSFLASWTEFLGALTFLTDTNLFTLPVALLNIQSGTYGNLNYGYLVAGSVIAMVPCVILYVALQRFYIGGLSSGAVKG
ncbi:multiple sugar transport system permease protein [Nakamurella sp. UYEF19]|uniref:carbohydrate ABC transporter permease n=1 Tax=Nakamurella sp. UYEF19 TaxID=1756392 RepID=UPI00339B3B14